jgi:hypothetical protein
MAKKVAATTTISSTDSSLAVFESADAVAVGENALTTVDSTSITIDTGQKIKSTGEVTATAVADSADGDTAFTSADTDVYADADKVKIKETSLSSVDGTYQTSTTEFKIKEYDNKEDAKLSYEYTEGTVDDSVFSVDLDGNTALLTVDAEAIGENTLVTVDAFVLTVEDELSQTTVSIISAVD